MIHKSDQHLESLAKFHISFEHDKTWSEAKKAIKDRSVIE